MKAKTFTNRLGIFQEGDYVTFEMENADMWGGDRFGELFFDKKVKDWKIKTKNSGIIDVGGYLQAYPGTIMHADRPLEELYQIKNRYTVRLTAEALTYLIKGKLVQEMRHEDGNNTLIEIIPPSY